MALQTIMTTNEGNTRVMHLEGYWHLAHGDVVYTDTLEAVLDLFFVFASCGDEIDYQLEQDTKLIVKGVRKNS